MNLARELLAETKTQLVGEWQTRTRYGKVWYPMWLLMAALELLSFLIFTAFMVGLAYFYRGLEGDISADVPTPAIYKKGEREE